MVVCAQVPSSPPETSTTVVPSGLTATGLARSMIVPSPSSPLSLRPQQRSRPVVSTAHVWSAPAASRAGVHIAPEPAPTTLIGALAPVSLPPPSWPHAPSPQHL